MSSRELVWLNASLVADVDAHFALLRFLAESVFDLKSNLAKIKSDLRVEYGLPEKNVPALIEELKKNGMDVEGVFLAKEVSLRIKHLPAHSDRELTFLRVSVSDDQRGDHR